MKLNRFFMLSVAGLALAACSNEDAVINPTDDGTSKTMIVSIAGISSGTTRANAPVDGWEADSNAGFANISKIALLFTNASGEVLYEWDIDKPGEEVSSGDEYNQWNALTGANGVKFIGLNGVTQVHAVANLDVLEEGTGTTGNGKVAVGENISELSVKFTQQGINAAATKGSAIYVASDLDINPLQQEPANATEEVTLDGAGEKGDFYYAAHLKLMPIISRIQINSIKVQSSGSVLFPEQADGNITANKFKLAWSNFKPTLYGIYLNNFYDDYSLLSATATDLLNNTSYMQQSIEDGKWNFGTPAVDYVTDAAYVNYSEGYQSLLSYGIDESSDPVLSPLTLGEGKCIAFNVFVPFDITNPDTQNASSTNPTIHFQFDKTVTGYTVADATLANGDPVTDDADLNYIASAETKLDYTLPTVQEGYLFANISKLYKESTGSTELVMQPGKIYNMDVVISPVNMTVDLDNPETYNVVVTIEVVDFTAENIYPGLD